MRKYSAILTATCLTLVSSSLRAAGHPTLPQPLPSTVLASASQSPAADGVLEETPNQRRRRLGQEIVASFPPQEIGEAIETPNHRRQRLGLPIVASYEDLGK